MTSPDIDLQDRPRRLPRLSDAVPDSVRRRDQAEARDYSRHRVVGARHPGRTAGTLAAAAVIIVALQSILTNERWEWGVFAEWFFAEPVMDGLGRTLLLTAAGSALGFLLGTGLALARVSKSHGKAPK